VIDTADFLEKVLQVQAATEHDTRTFAKIGYGKGDVSVANMWREITQKLDALREVTVQVMKRGITPPLAPPERLREAETGPLHPAGRRHTLR
jgi:hypothetical protein